MNKEIVGSPGKDLVLVTGGNISIKRWSNSITISIEDINKLLKLIK